MANIRFGFLAEILVYLNFEFILVFRIVVRSPFDDWSLSRFIHLNRSQSAFSVSITIMSLISTFVIPKRKSSNRIHTCICDVLYAQRQNNQFLILFLIRIHRNRNDCSLNQIGFSSVQSNKYFWRFIQNKHVFIYTYKNKFRLHFWNWIEALLNC